MSRPFDIRLEEAYRRRVLLAIELLDAVTLSPVTQGVKIVAEGLQGKPIINASGLFVWLDQDISRLQKISIDPGTLPYEQVELAASELTLPLTPIELPPRADYQFAAGVTGLRGRLIEEQVVPPEPATPVPNARVHLRWLDDNATWQDASTISRTDVNRGDFVSILRLSPTEVPHLDNGAITVRLRASRNGGTERQSDDFQLRQGRVTDPSIENPLTFAWDEFQS